MWLSKSNRKDVYEYFFTIIEDKKYTLSVRTIAIDWFIYIPENLDKKEIIVKLKEILIKIENETKLSEQDRNYLTSKIKTIINK
jgi:hypothetical protein